MLYCLKCINRLVAPVKDLDGRACLTHGRPLELYSRAEGRCVCALCVEEGHEVISVEMEWDRKKVSYCHIFNGFSCCHIFNWFNKLCRCFVVFKKCVVLSGSE